LVNSVNYYNNSITISDNTKKIAIFKIYYIIGFIEVPVNLKQPAQPDTTKIQNPQNHKVASQRLSHIKKLVTDLNTSLLELKKEKDQYRTQINECRDLCLKIRELMDATTTRIITKPDSD
jgi:hypothetical protein